MSARSALLLSLAAVACATPIVETPGGRPAPIHQTDVPGIAEHVWYALEDTYRSLGIPVAGRDHEAFTLRSGDLLAARTRVGGSSALFRCGTDLNVDPALGSDTYATVITRLEPDGAWTAAQSILYATRVRIGVDGRTVHQECASTGVIERRILDTLRRFTS